MDNSDTIQQWIDRGISVLKLLRFGRISLAAFLIATGCTLLGVNDGLTTIINAGMEIWRAETGNPPQQGWLEISLTLLRAAVGLLLMGSSQKTENKAR